MKQGIYQIENNINHKKYIGQSTHIENRWWQHKNVYKEHLESCPLLYRAFIKYGIENFTFSILEEVENAELLDDKETYYIQRLSTLTPNGYNCVIPNIVLRGEFNPNSTNTKEDVENIKQLLYNTDIPIKDIAAKYNITPSTVYRINTGKIWTDSRISYPIRKTNKLARIGEANGRSIFSDEEVLKIREQYVNMSVSELYEFYKDKCSFSGFKKIVQGTTFKHLPVYSKITKKWLNK